MCRRTWRVQTSVGEGERPETRRDAQLCFCARQVKTYECLSVASVGAALLLRAQFFRREAASTDICVCAVIRFSLPISSFVHLASNGSCFIYLKCISE